jgi:hypothetical protein
MSYQGEPRYLPRHIYFFTGTIAQIPAGMQLCNGTNGTVDLRNRFIVCADADSGGAAKSTVDGAAAQSGGAATKQFDVPIDSTTAGALFANSTPPYGNGSNFTANHAVGSGSGTSETKPGILTKSASIVNPFYALAFIQRIGG